MYSVDCYGIYKFFRRTLIFVPLGCTKKASPFTSFSRLGWGAKGIKKDVAEKGANFYFLIEIR